MGLPTGIDRTENLCQLSISECSVVCSQACASIIFVGVVNFFCTRTLCTPAVPPPSINSESATDTPAADMIEWEWLGIFYLMDVFHVVSKVICAPPPILLVLYLNVPINMMPHLPLSGTYWGWSEDLTLWMYLQSKPEKSNPQVDMWRPGGIRGDLITTSARNTFPSAIKEFLYV